MPAPRAVVTTTASLALVLGLAVTGPATASAAVPARGAPAQAEPGTVRIHDVQGTTRLSPFAGQTVAGVPGIVTALRTTGTTRGFWFQDPAPDADPRTSEGLFVFTGSTSPTVAVGDDVLVDGTVTEFRAGGAASAQTVTELTRPVVTTLVRGVALPTAEVLTTTSVPQTYTASPGGDIERQPLEPTRDALDFEESREGMRVAVTDARVVGPTTAFGELWVTTKPAQNPTIRGGTAYDSYADPNSGRLKVESLASPVPAATVGDRLAGTTTGVLDYESFGGYTLAATALGDLVRGGTTPEVTRRSAPGEIAVASYNVENLDPGDPAEKVDALARQIVTDLAAPDVLALEEVQDDNGPTNDAVVTDDVTLTRLVDAVAAAGGPRYAFRSVDPTDDTTGGEPGGNTRNAFLFDPVRVTFRDRPGGTATSGTEPLPRRTPFDPIVSASPGLVDPANPAWNASRRPLVGEFESRRTRLPFLVVANHFTSKGGDQPLHGRFQPPARTSEVQRNAQAEVLRGFLDRIDVSSRFLPTPVIVTGDFNDFPFSRTLQILTERRANTGLPSPFVGPPVNLMAQRPANDRYSYVFDGNSQAIDHILVADVRNPDHDVVHVNAEFPTQASDHDPQVLRFRLP